MSAVYDYRTGEVKVPVKVWRETDPTEFVRIINDPAVFPLISLPGQNHFEVESVQALLDDPRHILLMCDGGGMLFDPSGDGLYEVHINFLPTRRGRYAVEAVLAACHWIFTHTDCWMLQTRVPPFNKPAETLCKLIGASFWFERAKVWPSKDGPCDMKFFTLTLQDWARKYPQPLIESGKAFHAKLEAEFARFGIAEPHHPQEDCHDLAVGLCAEMIYGGQPEKAVILYNRWARFAGYGEIAMIQRNPLVIDIGDAVLLLQDQTFKVLTCRPAQRAVGAAEK